MNESTEKLLLLLGGAALGSLAVLVLSKSSSTMRPTMTNLAAGALDLRDAALGTLQRTKEDIGDFMAEVEHARNVKAEQETTQQTEPKAAEQQFEKA
jgi:hypothetical protein